MAKFVKTAREITDINEELDKIKGKKEKKEVKETKKKEPKVRKNSFFSEVGKEVSKVNWPSRKDMLKYSIATISFILFFATFFYLIDLILALLKTGV